MNIELRPAALSDVPDLVTILRESSEFKVSQGDELWTPTPFTTEEVTEIVVSGNTHVASIASQAIGSVVLMWNDARMWGPEKGNDNQAAYIHRLAIKDGFRGQGLGELIVAWASAEAFRDNRRLLRLDCSYENPKLCSYYQRMGFKEVGRKELHNPRYTPAFYEKSIY